MTYHDAVREFAKLRYDAFKSWTATEPNRRRTPAVASVDGSEALVSGDYVVELIVESISNRTPVVVSGPRGCGKSWCVFEAVERAVERKIVPGDPKDRTTWGFVFTQGNKELPREYLMEDEARIGGTPSTVSLFLKGAPMLQFAVRDKVTGKPQQFNDGSLQSIWQKTQNEPSMPFVLFLDEVNRFSDGVLDSLLLLLEERQIVRDGKPMKVDCAVAMTMNPPGYDGTAKRLSPPLQARLGRVIPLCTPDFTTTYDISKKNLPITTPEDELALKRACLVSIALWGIVEENSAAYRYLTPQSRILLKDLATQPALAQPMELLGKECSYGPDVRGVRHWVSAALAQRASIQSGTTPPLGNALQYCFDTTMLHRISTRFVEASSAAKLAQVENAARVICDYVLMLPADSPHLKTVYDDIGTDLATVLENQWGISVRMLRATWHAGGRSSDAELLEFASVLTGRRIGATSDQILEELIHRGWVEPGIPPNISTRRPELALLDSRTRAIYREMGESLPPMLKAFTFVFSPSLFSNPDAVESELQKTYDAAVRLLDGILNRDEKAEDKVQYEIAEEIIEHIRSDNPAVWYSKPYFTRRLADDLMECNRRLQDWVSRTASDATPPPNADPAKTTALDAALHSVLSKLHPPARIGGRRLGKQDVDELIARLKLAMASEPPKGSPIIG